MYDQLILRNDRGNTYTFLFVHGYLSDGMGGNRDVTKVISIYQNVDRTIFDVEVLSEQGFEMLRLDLTNRRGYYTPGSDTAISLSPVDIEDKPLDVQDPPEWDVDLDLPNPADYDLSDFDKHDDF